MCQDCLNDINRAIEFKRKSEHSEEQLKHYLELIQKSPLIGTVPQQPGGTIIIKVELDPVTSEVIFTHQDAVVYENQETHCIDNGGAADDQGDIEIEVEEEDYEGDGVIEMLEEELIEEEQEDQKMFLLPNDRPTVLQKRATSSAQQQQQHKQTLRPSTSTSVLQPTVVKNTYTVKAEPVIDERPKNKLCNECGNAYYTMAAMRRHQMESKCGYVDNMGSSADLFYCDNCNTVFKKESGLILHKSKKICTKNTFICFYCNEKCSSRSVLLSHFSRKHQLDAKADCSHCNECKFFVCKLSTDQIH